MRPLDYQIDPMETDPRPLVNGLRLERKYRRVRRAFLLASCIDAALMAVVAYLLWYMGRGR